MSASTEYSTTVSNAEAMTFSTNSEALNWWEPNYCQWTYHPVYYPVEDKGKKAFEIVKVLAEKKFVEIRTGRQFIDLMETILAAL